PPRYPAPAVTQTLSLHDALPIWLMDERALAAALAAGRPGWAALDVFDTEPIPIGHPLLALPTVTISPHLGYVNAQVFSAFHHGIVEALAAWLDGAPIRLVNARRTRECR